MHPTWIRAAVGVAVLALAGVPACGDDELSPARTCSDCGGDGGGGDGAGAAGGSISAGASSTHPRGGAGGSAGGAAPGGAGTSDPVGGRGRGQDGTAGAGGIDGQGGGGASSSDDGEQLQVCARLANGADDALTVQTSYTSALYEDCRVRWLFPKGVAYVDFVNQLRRFSFQFWGCPGTPRVYTFALVSGTPALSQGDVNLLIDHYLVAADAAVDLTSLERQDMQAALARLSKPLIVDPSLAPSQAACASGGAGGADSGGAAGADAGGSPGAGGAAASAAGGAL